jgi:hypothetical protein
MYITFNINDAFNSQSNDLTNAYILRALLNCMVELNKAHLILNPKTPRLYESGVKYARTVLWEPIPALYARQMGDCKSLATARIAELQLQGVSCEPVFRFYTRPDGNKDFHILVRTARGWEDPSRKLGMGTNEFSKVFVDNFGGESLFQRLGNWLRR